MAVIFKTQEKQVAGAKSTAVPKAKVAAKDKIKALVDEYGQVTDECKSLMELPVFKRQSELAAEIQKVADEKFKADEAGILDGHDYAVSVTGKSKSSDLIEGWQNEVSKILGMDTFLKLVKIGITDLRKYLSKPQQDKLIKMEAKGNRTLKPSKKVSD